MKCLRQQFGIISKDAIKKIGFITADRDNWKQKVTELVDEFVKKSVFTHTHTHQFNGWINIDAFYYTACLPSVLEHKSVTGFLFLNP